MSKRTDLAVLLTGVGKRHDIVSAFSRHAVTIAADPSPLAPAQYAADHRIAPPRVDDPAYLPFLREVCEQHGVKAVVPLTDLDLELLARSDLPAFVPPGDVAQRTFDKWRCHGLLTELGLPSPPTVLPGSGDEPERYPVIVKPRQGSGTRSVHVAADPEERDFFVRYVKEPTVVQVKMDGPEFSIDLLCDLDGRCLNAIPRSMIESRGGESIKGQVLDDPELVALGKRLGEALGVRGPTTMQCFRDAELGLRIHDVNTRFGGAFAAPMYAARPGRTYPELIVRMAAGEAVEPHVGDFRAGLTFSRWYEQLELDADLRPTGRPMLPPA